MSAKRGIVSWILWVAFALLECAMLSVYLIQCVISSYTSDTLITVGFVCATFALLIGLFLLCRFFVRNVKNQTGKVRTVLGILVPILILGFTAAELILYFVQTETIKVQETEFYRNAFVTEGNESVPFMIHGLSYAYQWLLRAIFLVFGNQVFAGIMAQIVLLFISLLFGYLGVRKLAGVAPACLATLAMAVVASPFAFCFTLTPEMLGLAVFGLLLFSVGCVAEHFDRFGFERALSYLPVIFVGMLIGGAIYLDVIYAVLLFFVFGLALVKESSEAHRQVALLFVWELIGVILGLMLVAVALYFNGVGPVYYVQDLWKAYTENAQLLSTVFAPDLSPYWAVALLCCAFWVVTSQVFLPRQRSACFVAALLVLTVLQIFTIGVVNYQLISTALWCILAAIGVQSLFVCEKVPQLVAADAEADRQEEIPDVDDLPEEEDIPDEKAVAKAEAIVKGEDITKVEEVSKADDHPAAEARPTTEDRPKPGAPLPNPLKGPKKHRKREMNYALEVTEDRMHYDLEVDDGDDFDI